MITPTLSPTSCSPRPGPRDSPPSPARRAVCLSPSLPPPPPLPRPPPPPPPPLRAARPGARSRRAGWRARDFVPMHWRLVREIHARRARGAGAPVLYVDGRHSTSRRSPPTSTGSSSPATAPAAYAAARATCPRSTSPACGSARRWPGPGWSSASGMNYAAHAAETGAEPPAEPVIFFKAPNTVVGPDDDGADPAGHRRRPTGRWSSRS